MTEQDLIKQEAIDIYEPIKGKQWVRVLTEAKQDAYIAGASTRIPLLAEIERLKRENEELKDFCKKTNPYRDEEPFECETGF